MKKYQFTILLLFVFSTALAQQDTITVFQSARGYYVDPIRAKLKRVVTQKDSLWIVSLYNKKDQLQESISFADKNLEARKGPYLLKENSLLKQQGFYSRGYKHGEWKSYYPNLQLKEKATYRWDMLNGEFHSYWPDGSTKKHGYYLDGRKVKDWNMYYENNKPALKENFDESGKLLSGIYFESNGEQTEVPSFYISPSYPGGTKSFYNFLFSQIKNNKSNAIYATYGTIRVEFVVKIDGSITDITVNGTTDSYLEKELTRVMKLAGDWIPAIELGEPIRSRHIIPINFFSN